MNLPFKIIDLTHTLTRDIPVWDLGCGFEHHLRTDYDASLSFSVRTYQLNMYESAGTHIDAPVHCVSGGKCVHDLALIELIAPCVVIDVSGKAHERYSLTSEEICDFESHFGQIPQGAFVIVYTGWEKFWSEPGKYRNNYLFPSVSAEAAMLLLERGIAGLGVDTLSPDRPEDDFPVHKLILGAGKYIVENVANAGQMPSTGAYSLALPIKIQDGAEAPLRLVGLLMENDNE
jgi:kynurenine formamidase